MKLSQLIVALEEIKKNHGNMEVFLASDEEGNDFHSLNVPIRYGIEEMLSDFETNEAKAVKGITIYPNHDNWVPLDK